LLQLYKNAMKILNIFILLFLIRNSNALTNDQGLIVFFGGKESFYTKFIPELASAKDIKLSTYTPHELEFNDYNRAENICLGQLVPFHKTQKFKEYHLEVKIVFKTRSFDGASSMCDIHQPVPRKCKGKSGNDLRDCANKKKFTCLKNKIFNIKVLSDLYLDSCGNKFRGFSIVRYGNTDETIMTLVSPGHKLEVDQVFSRGVATYKVAEPVPVDQSQFFFLAESEI
jgi:hypothetical protein